MLDSPVTRRPPPPSRVGDCDDDVEHYLSEGAVMLAFASGAMMPLAFIAAAMAGVGVHLARPDVPMSETLVAVSVSVLVLGLCWRRRLNAGAAIALFSLAGLLHGYAYGESIVGAEPAPLVAYLLGHACIQYALALGAWWTAGRLVQPATRQDVLFRGACASFIFVPGVGFSVMSLLG